MTSMNRLNANAPWNLNDHTINKTDINFFVKLVHVDRYGFSASKKAPHTQTNHGGYKRREEIEGEKIVEQSKMKNLVMPSKIISQIPLWNHKRQTSKTLPNKQPLIFLKTNSAYKNRNKKLKKQFKDSPNKKRSQTEYFNQINQQQKRQDCQQLKVNKTFSLQFSFKSRIKTEPDERDDKNISRFNNTSIIEKKTKRETIKQILFFKPDKIQKKKQFIMKRFRTNLNKAKFSNSLLVKQIPN